MRGRNPRWLRDKDGQVNQEGWVNRESHLLADEIFNTEKIESRFIQKPSSGGGGELDRCNDHSPRTIIVTIVGIFDTTTSFERNVANTKRRQV